MGLVDNLTKNPSLIALAALGIGLFIFRDKISDFFQKGFDSIGEGLLNIDLPNVNLGDINFPEFPQIEFPDFTNIFKGFQDQLSSIAGQTVDGIFIPKDTTVNDDGTVTSSTSPTFSLSDFEKQEALNQLEINRLRSQLENALFDIPASEDLSGAEFTKAINEEEFKERNIIDSIVEPIRTILGGDSSVIVPTGDELSLGGGLSFIGGTTTFGDNIIDTFSEVLNIFPNLRASEISNLLAENVGLTGSEFALIDPAGEINISNVLEGGDIGSVTSGDFGGLTPDQISKLILGGNINNF